VGTANDLPEVLDLHARVTLGRGEARVAEKSLDVPDVGTALEEVRRHAVGVISARTDI
jgi:hypothetical protein